MIRGSRPPRPWLAAGSMNNRRAQLLILAEDRQHEVFLRRFLMAIGRFDRRQIDSEFAPSGRGAGEQFVRERYPQYLNTYRQKAARLTLKLAVITDADALSVDQRHHRLVAELVVRGV